MSGYAKDANRLRWVFSLVRYGYILRLLSMLKAFNNSIYKAALRMLHNPVEINVVILKNK
jgi:hypothetical protein